MKKEFIVYEGNKFTLEWYFDNRGKSNVLTYFKKLSFERKEKLLYLFRLFGNMGEIFNKEKFRNEGNKIYALKASRDRFLCFFFDGAKVIITNAYEKKSEKMPLKEKQKALRYRASYIKRRKEDKYYE